jgi:excisionase family DNA binding protein
MGSAKLDGHYRTLTFVVSSKAPRKEHERMTPKPETVPAWITDTIEALPLFLTPVSAAAALGCSRRTVDRRIRSHELAMVRNGRKVLIPRTAVADFLARSA